MTDKDKFSLKGFEVIEPSEQVAFPVTRQPSEATYEVVDESELVESRANTDGWGIGEFLSGIGEELVGTGREDVPSFADYVSAGYENSVVGLALRGELPETDIPEDSPLLQSLAFEVAQEAGDLPASIPGFIAGGAAGTAVAGPGGGFAASFGGAVALPQGLRGAMMEAYRSGQVDTAGEFLDVVQAFTWEGFKGFVSGAGAAKAGKIVAGPLSKTVTKYGLSAPIAGATVAAGKLTAESTAMVSANAALEGRVPDRSEFTGAAVSMLAIKGIEKGVVGTAKAVRERAGKLEKNVMDVYEVTEIAPSKIADDAVNDLSIMEDVVGGRASPRKYADPNAVQELPTRPPLEDSQTLAETDGISDARKNIRKKIVNLDDALAVKDKTRFYEYAIDRFKPIADAIKKVQELDTAEETGNAYASLRLLAGEQVKIGDTLTNGVVFWDNRGKRASKGIDASIKPVLKKLPELTDYLVARRTINLEDRGIKSGFARADAEQVLSETTPDVMTAAKDLDGFNDALLDYYAASGMLSKKELADIKKATAGTYTPFSRVFKDDPSGSTGGGYSSLKAIVGSDRDIVNPLEVIPNNAAQMIVRADRNAAFVEVVDQLGKDHFKKVRSQKAILNKETGEFVQSTRAPLKANQIEVYRNGKREVYETSEDIKRALDGVASKEIDTVWRALSMPARVNRLGITNSLTFALSSFIRSEISTATFSQNNYIPFVHGLYGLYAIGAAKRGLAKQREGKELSAAEKKYSESLTRAIQNGAMGAAMVELERKYLASGVQKQMLKSSKAVNEVKLTPAGAAKAIGQSVYRGADTALGTLENISLIGENAPRFVEFMLSEKAGRGTKAAALDFREVAVDFAKRGSSEGLRTVRLLNAFLGARINGTDKFLRQLKDKPLQTSARAFAYVVLPAALAHVLNHYEKDEDGNYKLADWYRRLPDYQKDLYEPIKVGEGEDGAIMRVARGFDVGLLYGRSTQVALDYLFLDDPQSFKDLAEALDSNFLGGAIPAVLPDAITPIVEAGNNKNLFFDSPLISQSDEPLVAEEQATIRTTQIAKEIAYATSSLASFIDKDMRYSKYLGAAAIDNYVSGWTGTLGRSLMQTLDDVAQEIGIVEKQPKVDPSILDVLGITSDFDDDIRITDYPIVRSFFVRNPSLSAKPIKQFYKLAERNEAYTRSVNKLKETRPERAKQIMKEAIAAGSFVDVAKARKAVSTNRRAIQMIASLPDEYTGMTPRERRQEVDRLTKSLIILTEQINESIINQSEIMKEMLDDIE